MARDLGLLIDPYHRTLTRRFISKSSWRDGHDHSKISMQLCDKYVVSFLRVIAH